MLRRSHSFTRPKSGELWAWALLTLFFLNWILWQKRWIGGSCVKERKWQPKLRVLQYNPSYCVIPKIFGTYCNSTGTITALLHATLDQFDRNMESQLSSFPSGCIEISILVDPPEPTKNFQELTQFQLIAEQTVAQIIHVNGIENLLLHFVFQIPKENAGFSCLDYSLQKPINPLESMGQLLEWDIIEQPALTDDDLYPINLMRNVARMMLPKHALATVVDAHFRFSTDFVRNSLLAIETAKTPLTSIFIYPSFEGLMDAALLLPLTKPELKAGFDQGSVQPFMTLLNTQAHRLNDPDAWLANTEVGFQQVGFTHQAYQPQFISLNTVPFHNENFPFQMSDGVQQHWELCRAGYAYLLLNNAFALHPNYRSPEESDTVVRTKYRMRNRYKKALRLFDDYIETTYPKTYQMCPNFGIEKEPKRKFRVYTNNNSTEPRKPKISLKLYLNAIRTARREQLHKANVENAEFLEKVRAKRVALDRQIWGFDPSNLQLRIPNGTLPEPEQKPAAQRLPEVIEEQPGQLGT